MTLKRPFIMGVLNVTPDSFYDGGRYLDANRAYEHCQELFHEGANIVDIGAESSRPGSRRLNTEEELERVTALFERIAQEGLDQKVTISVDTTKSKVAQFALKHGAGLINDISGLRCDGQAMLRLLGDYPQVKYVLMHMQGDPQTMQQEPRYDDVVGDLKNFFEERLNFLQQHNISLDRVILDPGIGFGKQLEHNLEILRRIAEFKETFNLPLLIGASRKSMIGLLLDGAPLEQRLEGSLAIALWCCQQGVDYLRVHDVASTRRALKVWQALESYSVMAL